jgi:nicotinamide riboside transporter PnuC
MGVIKGLFGSKKFWLTLIGSAVVGALKYAGVGDEVITAVASLFGVSIAGFGLADMGKEAAKK